MHRLALLGCGDVATRDYLPELHRLAERVELAAVCSRSEERARSVAARYGAGAWYTDYRRMLAETDADLVANLTPGTVHAETTRAALAAGKHVYSEKPIASTTDEARHIAAEARRHGLLLVCAPCVMIFPQLRLAQHLIRDGAIGPIYTARGLGHGGVPPWHGFASDPSPYFAVGGGPAFDMGVYPLHALTGLLGPVRRVSAMTSLVQRSFVVPDGPAQGKEVPIEVDDNWHMLLDFGDRRLASLETSYCATGSLAPQLELMGLQGSIAVNLIDVAAPVELLRPDGTHERIDVPHARTGGGPDHILGIEHLLHCLDHDQQPVLSAEHAIHVVDVIEAAARSSREGRAIEVDPPVGGWAP